MLNALTVDVEEYFHPTEIQRNLDRDHWLQFPSRIDDQILRILDLFDEKNVKGTFFVLGWIAEHRPHVVRSIAAAGHEIACHSYWHELVYKLSPSEFRKDTQRAVAAIEDASGVTPRSYRAPSYSIVQNSLWALEVLVECGFTCDSSIYPIAHDRYGMPGFDRRAQILQTPSGPILEVPVATVRLSNNHVAPIGGGGYMRLLPYRYTSAGIRRVNSDEKMPACIYFHPWEIDQDQPRLASGAISKLRTYWGLRGMQRKLDRLLTDFRFSTLEAVYRSSYPAMAVAQAAFR